MENLKKGLSIVINKILHGFHSRFKDSKFLSIQLENMNAFFFRRDVKFSYNKNLKIFEAKDSVNTVYFNNKSRGFWLYRQGIKNRGNFLYSSYCLNNISFEKNDIVIDCGANSGDLYITLKHKINSKNYIAFEPNPSDFNILQMNVINNNNLYNEALGKENGYLSFYVNTKDGDSSLVRPANYDEIIKVKVQKLDTFINKMNYKSIKLLKVEAEGFEPEILHGSIENLSNIEYIAVDGGYERGEACDQTLTFITNYLLSNNFKIVDIYFPWYRALFKNNHFKKKQ